MVAFALVSDLEARLGTVLAADVRVQVAELLEDASTHLRSEIGQEIYPARSVTFDVWVPSGERQVRLPVCPVRSVTTVLVAGVAVTGTRLVDGDLLLSDQAIDPDSRDSCDPVQVTVTASVGLDSPPLELVSWTCVLASQVLSTATELGSLGSGDATSLAIDDYKKGFSSSESGAFHMPDRVIGRLRARYGGGTYVSVPAR